MQPSYKPCRCQFCRVLAIVGRGTHREATVHTMMPQAPASSNASPMGVATDPRAALTKSITRLLQHSILQLCNEHIGYTHKLQILGVLCMTIDDEQQELVVKVNNTLKRVNPPTPTKEGSSYLASPTQLPPPEVPSMPYSLANEVINLSGASNNMRVPLQQQQPSEQSQQLPSSKPAAASQLPSPLAVSTQPQPSPAESSSPGQHSNGRKSHGRKGTNPVKVHHVYDEGELISSEEDHENIVTVIPTDPDAALADVAPISSESGSSKATSSPLAGSKAPSSDPEPRMTGSSRRKPNMSYRVTQSSNGTNDAPPTIRALLLAGPRSHTTRPDTPLSYQGNNDQDEEDDDAPPTPHKGLSLPVVIHPDPNSSYDYSTNGDGALDFSTGRREDLNETSSDIFDEEDLQITGQSTPKRAKTSERHYDDDMPQNLALRRYLMNKGDQSQDGLSTDGLPTQVAYSGLPYAASSHSDDGLSIRYTSTGPITVGANGKSVSQSTLQKVKDIILYDDSTSPSSQKGSRIETGDFMVDSLGYENSSRKRRRRAPDEALTSEEIAEYLGFSSSLANGMFKCKFCNEEVQELTRYLQHTLTMHNAYICHQCGKSFTTKSSLLRHRPIHTGMRRFACSICKKTFYRKDKCKAHIKRHLGANSDPASIERFQKIEPIE